jgi:hypothetical protein
MNGNEQLPEIDYMGEVVHVFGEDGVDILIDRIIGTDRSITEIDAIKELYSLIPDVTAINMPANPETFTEIAVQMIDYQKLVEARSATQDN